MKIFFNSKLLCVTAPALLIGCASTLDVQPITNPGSQSGFKYELPLTQFKIGITRRAVACKDNNPTVTNKYVDDGNLILTNEATVVVLSSSDPNRRYVIDPRSLSHFFNKAGFSIEYHGGTRRIKTVNATVEDQAGSALTSVIKTAAGLGGLPAAAGGFNQLKCNSGLAKKIQTADRAHQKVKTDAANLISQNAIIKKIKAAQTAVLPNSSNQLNDQLNNSLTHQAALIDVLRASQAAYALASKPVIIKQTTFTWPTTGDDFEYGKSLVPSLQQMKTLANIAQLNDRQKLDLALSIFITNESVGDYARIIKKYKKLSTGKYVAVGPNEDGIHMATLPASDPSNSGIYYREPANGRLVIQATIAKKVKKAHNKVYPISQLGFIDILPVSARAFESLEFSAEFAKDGRLVKAGYKDTSVPASTVLPVIETLVGLKRAKQAQEDSDLAAEATRLENRIKVLDLESQLAAGASSSAIATAVAASVELAATEKNLIDLEALRALKGANQINVP